MMLLDSSVWSDSNIVYADQNGEWFVWVKDESGNVSMEAIKAENICLAFWDIGVVPNKVFASITFNNELVIEGEGAVRYFPEDEIPWIDYLETIEFTGYYKKNISSIDQKCTFDILHVNAKCILNFITTKNLKFFSINDFLKDDYTHNLYKEKTSNNGKAVIKEGTKKEYDKVIGNTLEMLSYSEVLDKKYEGNKRIFIVKKIEIIEKLAKSDMACVAFICHFI